MNELKIFIFDEIEIKPQMIDDEVWFIAKDVCDILGIGNPSQALSRLEEDERSTIILNEGMGNPQKAIVNEFGLYNLVLSSRKPKAKEFKRWITHDVIPSIRKTGGYQKPTSMKVLLLATLEHEEKIENLQNDVDSLKNEIDLSRVQKAELSKLIRFNAMSAVGGKKANAYSLMYRKAISEHWKAVKDYFEVSSYELIPKIKFEESLEVASMWSPSMELAVEIKRLNNQIEMEVE